MRLGLFELDLAHRFRVHVSRINRICLSWINFLYLKFGHHDIWPDKEAIDKAMPKSFKDKYPKTRVIIDGTEIKCQTPSSLVLHNETFSTYKSHTTFTRLIRIHRVACSRLRDGSGKSFSKKKCEKRGGLGRDRAAEPVRVFLTACSGISAPDIPSDWSIVTVNLIT